MKRGGKRQVGVQKRKKEEREKKKKVPVESWYQREGRGLW